jgi:hypothetical protein
MDNASTPTSLLADTQLDFHAGHYSLEGDLAAYHHRRNVASLVAHSDVVDKGKDLNLLDPERISYRTRGVLSVTAMGEKARLLVQRFLDVHASA